MPISELSNIYTKDVCCVSPPLEGLGVVAPVLNAPSPLGEGWGDILLKMLTQVYNDKGLPFGLINEAVTTLFATQLWQAVTEGYGGQALLFNLGVDYNTPDFEMLKALQKNTYQFAAAKNYTQLRELSNALISDDGKLRTFAQFKQAASIINEKHVDRYLKTEYNLAVASGQMASKWVGIEANAATLPYLEFDAVLDTQTTTLCKGLNGTLLPINHPFWAMYYPPNHFNCRSTIRQRAGGKITPEGEIPSSDIPPMFRTNMAKEGLVFPKGHAYFIDLPTGVLKQAEAMKMDLYFEKRIQGKNGGYVDIHSKTDTNKKEQHIKASIILADKGNQIKLMPEISRKEQTQRTLFFPELKVTNFKNPDARFNGILGDFKIPDNDFVLKQNIVDAINKTNKKEVSICAISLLEKKYNVQKILSGVKGGFKDNVFIKELWIIWNDKTILKIPRGIASSEDFWKIVKAL